VLARPTKQLGLYLQMAGRGLRPDEDSNKQGLILIDHSGAVYRHGLLEDPIEWTLDIDSKATNKNHAARAAQHGSSDPFIECTQCGATRERGEACGNCGFKPGPRPDPIIAKDADLVEYGKRPVPYSDADEVRWFRELLALRSEKNEQRVLYGKDPLKPAWSAAKHKEKFGHWPPYSWTKSLSPADDVSAKVRSWVRSRDIAYSKGKGAPARDLSRRHQERDERTNPRRRGPTHQALDARLLARGHRSASSDARLFGLLGQYA
jgi:hypothetical protein